MALFGFQNYLSHWFDISHMQDGSNIDLLREIRVVYRKLPRLHIKWLKVEAHLDREPHTLNKVLNIEMDKLAGIFTLTCSRKLNHQHKSSTAPSWKSSLIRNASHETLVQPSNIAIKPTA